MLSDMLKAKIVITNYHAFQNRERIKLSKTGRALLNGRGEPIRTQESDGQMLQRARADASLLPVAANRATLAR